MGLCLSRVLPDGAWSEWGFALVGESRDQLHGDDVRGRVLSSCLVNWCFIAEKPVPVCSEGENPGRCQSEVGTSAL